MAYDESKVINGTFGYLWLDGELVQEIQSVKATVTPKAEEVNQSGQMVSGTKITGLECKGELKTNKINSRWIKLMSESLRAGKQRSFTIISKLADPSNGGTERVKLTGCVFSELSLVDWELKKLTEDSLNFNFKDWEILDSIN
ncbi:phage tail tube protein [Anaerocolumna jejuensis]|uniref:phage tail tube protein n=1 Tax=Anaerocolumna jejuensis TaxID=259063 RepID=UPI003F7C4079